MASRSGKLLRQVFSQASAATACLHAASYNWIFTANCLINHVVPPFRTISQFFQVCRHVLVVDEPPPPVLKIRAPGVKTGFATVFGGAEYLFCIVPVAHAVTVH